MRLALGLLIGALAGCSVFLDGGELSTGDGGPVIGPCEVDDDCGPDGTCHPGGACLATDAECESGLRVADDAADADAGQCLPTSRDGKVCLDAPGAGGLAYRYCFDDYGPGSLRATTVFGTPATTVPELGTDAVSGLDPSVYRLTVEDTPLSLSMVGSVPELLAACNASGEATLELVVRLDHDSGVCGNFGCHSGLLSLVQVVDNGSVVFAVPSLSLATSARREFAQSGTHISAWSGDSLFHTDTEVGSDPQAAPTHLVVTMVGQDVDIFINGVAQDIAIDDAIGPLVAPSDWSTDANFDLRIAGYQTGKSQAGDYHFAGVYCRALSSGEIAERSAQAAAEFQ